MKLSLSLPRYNRYRITQPLQKGNKKTFFFADIVVDWAVLLPDLHNDQTIGHFASQCLTWQNNFFL